MSKINFYSHKKQLQYLLLIFAFLIGFISVWLINDLLKHLADEEQNKVRLWSGAIRQKARLVKITNDLFDNLALEERKKVEVWSKAVKELSNSTDLTNIDFLLEIIKENKNIPVVLVDEHYKFINCRNFTKKDSLKLATNPRYLHTQINDRTEFRDPIKNNFFQNHKNYIYYKDSRLFTQLRSVLNDMLKNFISEIVTNSVSVPVVYMDDSLKNVLQYGNVSAEIMEDSLKKDKFLQTMMLEGKQIEVDLGNGEKNHIFYQESNLQQNLKYYPLILFLVIIVFILFGYWVFSNNRRTEQNQVWVGMAKETAHQLGTPLSSLMAWVEMLKIRGVGDDVIGDIEADLNRLEVITERFSKIGSVPKLINVNICEVLEESINYMKTRTSQNVKYGMTFETNTIITPLNIPLFSWVIENLCRNAVDAMPGTGTIIVTLKEDKKLVIIDIADNGKGIPKSKFKTVFNPGYTTKKRGWGLGLSLVKRIVEEYHNGKIFVKESEISKGTTFRILLKKP